MRAGVAVAALLLGACVSPSPPTMIYPEPVWHAEPGPPVHSICLSPEIEARLAPLAVEAPRYGIAVVRDGGCDLRIALALGETPAIAALPSDWAAHPGHYAWTTAGHTVTVYADSESAAHHAVHALLFGPVVDRAAADWPAFAERGVIEGFYNRYFSRDQRATTLRMMHALRQNVYLYAPKDDPRTGLRWREPYSPESGADVAAAAALAAEQHIDFVYGLSPTQPTQTDHPETSFRFASDEDFAALLAKVDNLRALGVTRFAFLFDDAGDDLFHPGDRMVFSSIAEAHAELTNRLVAALGQPVYFVGSHYSALFDGWQDYNRELGERLDPRVQVMWTGSRVFSDTLGPADVSHVNTLLNRQVVIWDNWPKEAMPVEGRDPELFRVTPSLLTNATLVGDFDHPVADFWRVLGPLADYAWNSQRYQAQASYDRWQLQLPAVEASLRE